MVNTLETRDFLNHLEMALEKCKTCDCMKETLLTYDDSVIGDKLNQFIVMIKPEVLNIDANKYKKVIRKLLQGFDMYDVSMDAAFIMNGGYLEKKHLIESQYRNLNMGAKFGLKALNPYLNVRIRERYKNQDILGAYDFLKYNPSISCSELEEISHKIGSRKEGNGVYVFLFEKYNSAIINAFHPHQIEHFYEKGNCTAVFICSSKTDYKMLQGKLVGNFNPKNAEEKSLRNYVFTHNDYFGIKNIGIFYNCFHISPSPLEGMFAVCRYCEDISRESFGYENTVLGKKLLESGYTMEKIDELKNNPLLRDKQTTLFDYLELMPEETLCVLNDPKKMRKWV